MICFGVEIWFFFCSYAFIQDYNIPKGRQHIRNFLYSSTILHNNSIMLWLYRISDSLVQRYSFISLNKSIISLGLYHNNFEDCDSWNRMLLYKVICLDLPLRSKLLQCILFFFLLEPFILNLLVLQEKVFAHNSPCPELMTPTCIWPIKNMAKLHSS